MTLTLTNLSTGAVMTVHGVQPTSDDLIALQALEGLGVHCDVLPDGKYGLTSGTRIARCPSVLAGGPQCELAKGHLGLHKQSAQTWAYGIEAAANAYPMTPFGEQLFHLGTILGTGKVTP